MRLPLLCFFLQYYHTTLLLMPVSDRKWWYLFWSFIAVYFLIRLALRKSCWACLTLLSVTISVAEFLSSSVSLSSAVDSLHLLAPSCGFNMHPIHLWTASTFLITKLCLCLPNASCFSRWRVGQGIWERLHFWIVLMFYSYLVSLLFDDRSVHWAWYLTSLVSKNWRLNVDSKEPT